MFICTTLKKIIMIDKLFLIIVIFYSLTTIVLEKKNNPIEKGHFINEKNCY